MVVTGNAASVNAVKLVARVEGYLDKIHYEDGQSVKKGDLLFTIQQDQYKDQLVQAQAQVLAAQASLKHANTELPRYSALVKKDAATQTQVDQWVYEKASAEASLLSAQAQVALAKLNLGYTEGRIRRLRGSFVWRGTDGSNPVSSSGESRANLTFAIWAVLCSIIGARLGDR
jgi:RND family efflux transporter MFP subunit